MGIPDYQTLMKPVLLLFQDEEEHKTSEIVEKVSDEFKLTSDERNKRLPKGSDKVIGNRVGWAIKYFKEAGLLKNIRWGFYVITKKGIELIKENPDRIDNSFLSRYSGFLDFRKPNKQREVEPVTPEESSFTPEEQLNKSYEEINLAIKSELLTRILSQTSDFFEELVVKLLQAMGYGDDHSYAKVTKRSGDGGIDGVIHQDKLGLDIVYIQAKRHDKKNTIGRPDLQKFVGSISGVSATKGVFITTSSFSSEAKDYLKTVQQNVVLIDGDRLVELMTQHGVGVRAEQTYTMNRIDEDFFSD
jgi:restriction system protein